MWSRQGRIIWRWQLSVIFACSITSVVIGLTLLGAFQLLEWAALDSWFRLRPLEKRDPRIVIIEITEKDITEGMRWPINDQLMANLIEQVAAQNPRVIGLDIYRDFPLEPGHQDLIRVMQSTPQLIGIEKVFGEIVAPPPSLDHDTQIGIADFVVDADGKIRRSLLSSLTTDNQVKFSLGAKLALKYLAVEGISPQVINEQPQIYQVGQARFQRFEQNDGGYVRADDGGNQVLLNFRGVSCTETQRCPFQTISMGEFLSKKTPSNLLQDRIVLIGVTAPSLQDHFYNPYSYDNDATSITGVEVHAHLASQIISAALDGRSQIQTWSEPLEYLWVFAWSSCGIFLGYACLRRRRITRGILWLVVTLLFLLGSLIAGSYLLFIIGWWVPIIPSVAALTASVIVSTTHLLGIKLKLSYQELAQTNQQLADANQELAQTNQQLAGANQELANYSQNLEKKVEERTLDLLTAKEASDSANRSKNDFLANMSHELRTPLNTILGMTQALEEKILGELNPQQVKALQTTERSANHLLELINDILDLSKVESGMLELDCTPTAILPLCQFCLTVIKQQAHKKGVQLDSNLCYTVPILVMDERRIREAVINLLSNAVKFTPSGGLVTLEVLYQSPSANLDGTESSPQGILTLVVSDTGIGIKPDYMDKLFKPFVQIDSALNRQYTGTGLGLALVKRIAELHGGTATVTSEVDVGSRFTIEIPCSIASSPQPTKGTVPIVSTKPNLPQPEALTSILLVEDNLENITVIKSYLAAKGYRIRIANDGNQAISEVLATVPDVILMDIQLPNMDGLEAIRRIRREPTLNRVPIIALTALAMKADRNRCIAAGADKYLSKPVNLGQLVITIETLLGERAASV
ncbi:CHASE2 domain-containing protein [Leptothoe sp. PORK10 BA2]|uniref:CHASE2 domain-containing protein n=1 Tax=Leptothoe sp. PORK10 BA2 TaxID=3110254 RepID=UPI002B205C32|nr:CHASE2 domain-containing protein [Leptothoe sp. PORK10 BA2]MEA5464960.1 CHASE2 domain-containing protein [Leptothoe sp. PORK10 BA2]